MYSNLSYRIPENVQPQEVIPLYEQAFKDWLVLITGRLDDYTGKGKIPLNQYSDYLDAYYAKQEELELLAAAAGTSRVKTVRLFINNLGAQYPELDFHYLTQEFMNAIKAYYSAYNYNPREYLPSGTAVVVYEPAGLHDAAVVNPNCAGRTKDCPADALDWWIPGEWPKLAYDWKIPESRLNEIGRLLKADRRSEVPELQPGYNPETQQIENVPEVQQAGVSNVMKALLIGGGIAVIIGLLKAK
jgi:hypothetical protein